MADLSSPEYLAFKEASPKLAQEITNPESIAGLLSKNAVSKDFISVVERQAAEDLSTPVQHRTSELLDTISEKIEFQPDKFYDLIKIFGSSDSFVHIARLLEQHSPYTRKKSNVGSHESIHVALISVHVLGNTILCAESTRKRNQIFFQFISNLSVYV